MNTLREALGLSSQIREQLIRLLGRAQPPPAEVNTALGLENRLANLLAALQLDAKRAPLPYWVLVLRELTPWATRNAAETYCVICGDKPPQYSNQNEHQLDCIYKSIPPCIACGVDLEHHRDECCNAGGWTPRDVVGELADAYGKLEQERDSARSEATMHAIDAGRLDAELIKARAEIQTLKQQMENTRSIERAWQERVLRAWNALRYEMEHPSP